MQKTFAQIVIFYHLANAYGKMLMDAIIAHPRLKNIKNFELTCAPDMVGFYEKFGFSKNYGEVRAMRLSRNNQN